MSSNQACLLSANPLTSLFLKWDDPFVLEIVMCLTTSLTTSLTTPNPDFYVALDPQCLEDFEHFVVFPGLSILESMVLQKCPCNESEPRTHFNILKTWTICHVLLFEVLPREWIMLENLTLVWVYFFWGKTYILKHMNLKGEECLMESSGNLDLPFLPQTALQGLTIPVFRKHNCELWLRHSSKGLSQVHCPVGSGDSETSPVARQISSD